MKNQKQMNLKTKNYPCVVCGSGVVCGTDHPYFLKVVLPKSKCSECAK